MQKVSLREAFSTKGEKVEVNSGYVVEIFPWTGFQAATLWPPIRMAMEELMGSEEGMKTEFNPLAIVDKLMANRVELVWDILLETLRSPKTRMVNEERDEFVDLSNASAEDVRNEFLLEDIAALMLVIWRVCISPLLEKAGIKMEDATASPSKNLANGQGKKPRSRPRPAKPRQVTSSKK